MEATWNGALFSAATIRLPVSTQSSRRAFGKAVVQRLVKGRALARPGEHSERFEPIVRNFSQVGYLFRVRRTPTPLMNVTVPIVC